MGMESYKTVSINRKLDGVQLKHFSHTFPGWGHGKMVVSGEQASFNNVFLGFKDVPAIRDIFKGSTSRVLSRLPVGIYKGQGYAWVDVQRGRLRLMVARWYLRSGKKLDIYLDVIHELVHGRQHMEGMNLWDEKYAYVDRPTEIEAYAAAVREAKRLGVSSKEIRSYLRVPWVGAGHSERLRRHLGV